MLKLQAIIDILFTEEEFGRQTIAIDAETENQPETGTLTIPNIKKSTLEQRIRVASTIAEAVSFTDIAVATALGVHRSQISRWRESDKWLSAKIRLIALNSYGKEKCLESIYNLSNDYAVEPWVIFQWGGSANIDNKNSELKKSIAVCLEYLRSDQDGEIIKRLMKLRDQKIQEMQKMQSPEEFWIQEWKKEEGKDENKIKEVLAQKPHVDWQYALNALEDYRTESENKKPETDEDKAKDNPVGVGPPHLVGLRDAGANR